MHTASDTFANFVEQFRIDAAGGKATDMDVLTKMAEHHIWLTGEMIRVAAALTPEQLDQPIELETFVDPNGEHVEVISYGGNLAHVLTFAAHRRTLVLLALNAYGHGELGWGDPRHWVVDGA